MQHFEWLFGDATFISTLIGAVVGALAGGLVQLILSEIEIGRKKESKAAEENEAAKLVALSVIIKLTTIHSQIYSFISKTNEYIDEADSKGKGKYLCDKIAIIAGIPTSPILISVDECVFFLTKREGALVAGLVTLNLKVESLLGALASYSLARSNFSDVMINDVPALQSVRYIELRTLADGMCYSILEDIDFLGQVIDDIKPVVQRLYKGDLPVKPNVNQSVIREIEKFRNNMRAHGIVE